MDTMTLISQRPPSSNEVKRSQSRALEKEHQANLSTISELRFELNRMKNETLELAAKHNEELSSYESQFAKLRSEIEKGEAMRQSLEYELAVARKQCSMEKMSLEEEKINSLRLQEQFKAQIEDLHKKMNSVEFVFQTAQHTWVESKKTFENGIQSRDTIIQNFKREQQVTELEKSKLKSWLETQTNKVEELTKKLNEMETERNSFMDNLKHQKRELDYCLEREERLKAELEAVTLKAKKLDENIEAERAAHLESKFNSEIIQLRIRDLEGTLGVEKASHSQAAAELDMIKNQFKELERVYSIERNKAEDTAEKLKKLEEDFSISMIQLKLELDEKKQIVTDLSSNLKNKEEICVKLEHELALSNDRHSCVEESYDNAMRELQSLADSFTVSSQRTSGISKDKVKPAGFAVVLETLRHTLTDYQSRLEGASNELEEANNLYMKTKEELQASKQILQTLCSNLEKTQSDLLGAKQELNHLQTTYAHKESQISHFQMDLEKAQYGWEKEKLKVMEAENEIQKLTRAYQKDTEEKLTFLYSLYQRLVAGCVIIKQPENMLGKFSWPELCAVLQENVDVLIADLNRANEKVLHLEYVCKNRADVMREMQQSHEDSLNELAAQMKEQETCWQKQNRDLEQRYSVLLGEVQARAQKFQRVAEKYKDKIAVFEKTNDQMALQNVNVKNMLVNNEKDLKSLLTACALMTGALYPLYSRSCTLTTQKDILQHQVNTYVEAQREMMMLMQALSEPEERRHTKKIIVMKRNIKSKIHMFRKCVVAILAVNRLQLLGRSSSCLFTWLDPKKKGNGIIVCRGGAKKKTFVTGQEGGLVCYEEARRWFSSPELLTSVVVSVSELLGVLTTKDLNSQSYGHLINAAKNSFTKLMNKLQIEMERTTAENDRCAACFESESLVQRLARGLQRINSQTSHKAVTSTTSIIKCVTTLKKQIFDFTQRLHTTEVERRSLRLELSDLKQKMNELQKNTNNAETCNEHSKQSKCVPYEKFLCACEELNNALLREQQAQTLLNEQAQQLMELNNRIEVHSTAEREKDQMLSEAVKGLSEAKLELRRKDQSLRQLNRQLTQLEQDKRRIEESIQEAEIALHKAANDKDTLISHMKSVEVVLQKVRDHISLSWFAAIRNDFTLQLPKLHPSIFAVEGSPGGPGFTVCQNMIKMFMDIYQLTYSRTTALEKELASHQKHIDALKCELQTACLRETKSMFPINYALTKKTETSLDKTNLSEFLPLEAELDKSQSIMKATFGSIQSHSINSL